jgi:hypothetical protein
MALIAPRIEDSNHGAAGQAGSRIRRASGHRDRRRGAHSQRRQYRQRGARARRPERRFAQVGVGRSTLGGRCSEAIELRLDDAEANLSEALRCGDPRRRDSVSMFMLRNVQRASKRGYAVAASAASLEVGSGDGAQPQTYVIRWGDGPDREMETIERDGREISIPRYDNGRGDGCLEGEVATPAVLIEHAAPVASEPQPVASSLMEALSVVPEPESAAVRYARERIDTWIGARLIDYPLASCLLCRKPIIAGQDWQEVSNGEARACFHRTCHAEWRAEREAAARQALGLED